MKVNKKSFIIQATDRMNERRKKIQTFIERRTRGEESF